MKAPPVTRAPIERIFRIHEAIQARTYPNTLTLAQKLEVSRKSILRDIQFMRDRLRLPIDYDPQHWGYYYAAGPQTILLA